jgi:lipopolysaccharide transport system ATP-binding protein
MMVLSSTKPVEKRHPSGCKIQFQDVVLRYPVGPFIKGSLKTSLFHLFGHRPIDKVKPRDYVTALNGLSITIERGERVGIIGRNGAGKSTTLQTIAGIYPIAGGTLTVQGKIQALFNIGLGFEPDATGRENIRYRGLSMGCPPKEINNRIEEIVGFADIGEFIDLPVRMYSSGMYVRLAFAISTYLEGDILLIDEIFGAGDAGFQKKAQERLRHLVNNAGIVVMVSHDMNLIMETCTRVLWIERGHVQADGDAKSVVKKYQDAA